MEKTNHPKIILIAASIFCTLAFIVLTSVSIYSDTNKNLLVGEIVSQANIYQGELVLLRDFGDSGKNNFRNQQVIKQINDIL